MERCALAFCLLLAVSCCFTSCVADFAAEDELDWIDEDYIEGTVTSERSRRQAAAEGTGCGHHIFESVMDCCDAPMLLPLVAFLNCSASRIKNDRQVVRMLGYKFVPGAKKIASATKPKSESSNGTTGSELGSVDGSQTKATNPKVEASTESELGSVNVPITKSVNVIKPKMESSNDSELGNVNGTMTELGNVAKLSPGSGSKINSESGNTTNINRESRKKAKRTKGRKGSSFRNATGGRMCVYECVFRSQGLLGSGGNVDMTVITSKFLAVATPSWKPVVQAALTTCAAQIAGLNLGVLPTPPPGGRVCNPGPALLMSCVHRHNNLNCPTAVAFVGGNCPSDLQKLKTCDVYAGLRRSGTPA